MCLMNFARHSDARRPFPEKGFSDPDAEAPGQALFETVAEEVFARYGRRWKPGTLKVNRIYLRQQILPFFEGRPIGATTRGDVQSWFCSLHATAAAANRSAPILSVIMRQAEAWGSRSGPSSIGDRSVKSPVARAR